MYTHGINGYALTFREFFNVMGAIIFITISIVGAIVVCIVFFSMCSEDKIQFNIDLLAPFKSRHKSPEEEDKEKK